MTLEDTLASGFLGPITVTVFASASTSGTSTIGDHGSPKSSLSKGVIGAIIGAIVVVCIQTIGEEPDINASTPEIENIGGGGYDHPTLDAYEATPSARIVSPHRSPDQPEIRSSWQSPSSVYSVSTLPSYPGTVRSMSPPEYMLYHPQEISEHQIGNQKSG
ncbi:hypothetical protein BDZ94DRAFT_1313111 [Collybia nuda]|uniref:Uncharacterized protein n=1 Tax=Collybia nuda TaxID=64659 RepID=A0A9P5XVQ8_9AGAR|nr:hypothetical protein BDZ94DRAFT_1313111 [Collybia nuda]